MEDFEARRIGAYFDNVIGEFGTLPDVRVVAIAHMVPNTLHFLPAVNRMASLALMLPKPKSVGRPEFATLTKSMGFAHSPLSRDWSSNAELVIDTLARNGIRGGKLVLVDIGGYFAGNEDSNGNYSGVINEISRSFPGDVLGVMEGTENGVQKYEKCKVALEVPLVTVARSRLKLPEDYLVGSSVVFSIEGMLREIGQILQTRTACVIGYGRVGSAVASVLRGRGIATVVHDTNPVALAEAAAEGFQAYRRVENAVEQASLVIGATGNHGISKTVLGAMANGAAVATVTSSDDELERGALEQLHNPILISETIYRYERGSDRYFWLLNNGNAANFVHGAVIGPAIQLIEGEKLAAIHGLGLGSFPPGQIAEVDDGTTRRVAEIWNEHFLFD